MLLKKDLINAIKTKSDAYKMGVFSRKSGKSKDWQPFDGYLDLERYWLRGWIDQDNKMSKY